MVGRSPCPAELVNHRCTFGVRGAERSGEQPTDLKQRSGDQLEKPVIPKAALGAQSGELSYETVYELVQPGRDAP